MKKLLFLILFLFFVFPLAAKAQVNFYASPALKKLDSFTIIYKDKEFTADSEALNSWFFPVVVPRYSNLIYRPLGAKDLLDFNFNKTAKQPAETVKYSYRPSLVYAFVSAAAKNINTDPVDPELTIENQRAINFIPPQDGLKVDIYKTTEVVLAALSNNQNTANITAAITPAQTKLSQLNSLGINELVGRGESNFKGSPNNRRHNIKVGIEKFKGIILKPGEEFSFNKFLGPVEKEQGFLPELVIKKEGTVPELGGGLCQVSTTTFRAAMATGLPITARKNHAYAVQYYSPQGTDATIYPGSSDLKFINDTPGYLLIWPYLKDNDNLVYDFYGTKDGRQITLEKPVVYDRKTDGSMKATWTRLITNNGTTTTDTFKSVYQSPALFHKTEEFVSATVTPVNGLTIPKTN